MNDEGNLLKYGDCICLSSTQGFLCSQGFTRTSCFIQVHYSKTQTYQRNMRDFVFQIVPKMNYDAFKEFNKFKKEYNKAAGGGVAGARSTITQQDKIKLGNLTKKLQEEIAGNKKMFSRRQGEVVSYGEEIQLLHYDSNSFIEGNKQCAEKDRSCYMIRLTPQGNKNVFFTIEPRYKYRNEGQSVNYGDVVIFKNVKSQNFLHISAREAIFPKERSKEEIDIKDPYNFKNVIQSDIDRRMLPDEYTAMYEVNTSSQQSNFTLRPFRNYSDELAHDIIKGGQVVRLQHSESGGFISSDDHDCGDGFDEVFLWNYKGKPTDIEALSTQTYFELEIVDNVNSYLGRRTQYSGNSSNETAKAGGMHFRLRHLNTGRLIVTQESSHGGLTVGLSNHLKCEIKGLKDKDGKERCQFNLPEPDYMDYIESLEENSVFRLVSTGVDMSSGISANTSVQIQHVKTGRFLQLFQKKQTIEEDNIVQGSYVQPNFAQGSFGDEKSLEDQPIEPIEEDDYQKEDLDTELFQKIDDIGNLGTRDMLTLEENASFENAFFIAPESKENLAKVLFVHTSVNWLNSFLPEISSSSYGESKERQKKIQKVIEEMIQWLQTDEDSELDGESGRYLMNLPYSLRSNDEFARKQRNLQIKQKYMRELRVIECIVDILHMPFASGQFVFAELKQEDAIIQLMQLCYTLLSQIVSGYRLNEMYTAQWIGIFLTHVLEANDDNAVGADNFMRQLCDENETILEKMITTHLLERFVEETERGKEAPRSLSLLTALCATQNKTIKENQNDVVTILLENDEAREKLLMPLRRLKKRLPIEVCFDLSQQRWLSLQKVCEMHQSVQKRLAKAQDIDQYAKLSEKDEIFMNEFNSFIYTLDLFAETCLERNKNNQKKLAQYFENKLLIAIFTDETMNYLIRSRSLRLYLESCLDIDPFQRLAVPSGQVVWKDLPSIDFNTSAEVIEAIKLNKIDFTIKFSKVRIPNKIEELKIFMCSYLEQIKGVIHPDEEERNDMTISVLKAIKFMVSHGFYKSSANLATMSAFVVELLNGSKGIKKYKPAPDEEVDSEFEEIMTRCRYFPDSSEDPLIQSKILATEILLQISNLELDAKCNIFLAKLKKDIELFQASSQLNSLNNTRNLQIGIENQEEANKDKPISSTAEDLELLAQIAGQKGYEAINEQQYVCILFDLLLYRYNELQAKVFNMLVNYFTRKRIMMECLTNTQILESSKSTVTLNEIKKAHNSLLHYYGDISYWLTSHNESGKETKELVSQIFEKLTKFCIQDDALFEEDEEEELDITSPHLNKSNLSQIRQKMTINTDKALQQKLELQYQREKQNKIEETLIFDIDKSNATPNRENQRLLQSFDIVDISLSIIKTRVDRTTNYAEEYKQLIRSCYRFLCAYVRGNFQNQLKVYDDVDVFMRDMDSYQAAVLLFYEIFKDNTKFLTLNVTKFIRTINNTAEEVSLNQIKKAINLKLLEVFCRYQSRLIKVNQSEIILQMTADISRSNVIYLFQAEGSKELCQHIDASQIVYDHNQIDQTQNNVSNNDITNQDRSAILRNDVTPSRRNRSYMTEGAQGGLQKMSVQIFNVIQLLELITLCCNGKSPIAESKCKENILDFKNAVRLIKTCADFWPLKIALFDYIIQAYMNSNDPNFMRKPTEEEQNEEEDGAENAVDESDVGLLLQLIEVIIDDYEAYKSGESRETKLKFPNGKKLMMKTLQEKYIYSTVTSFIKATLKRKTYDVGSVELKFYVVAKHIADCFYIASTTEQQVASLDLLKYIYTTDRHSKYLDNVKHPAKKGRQNKEIIDNLEQSAKPAEVVEDLAQVPEMTNSNRLFQRITQLSYSHEFNIMKESEFTELVVWVTEVEDRVQENFGKKNSRNDNHFANVTYDNVVLSLLRLLDSKQLNKELQIAGLSIIRKIVEMENKGTSMPAADWKTQQFTQYRKQIRAKQQSLIELGTIQFLCKHISEVEDPDIQEECLLVCISLIIGGNQKAQQTFFQFMMEEDAQENKFMLTIKSVLMQNFELTKKYMIEKNAKLEMVHKMKQRPGYKPKQQEQIISQDNKKKNKKQSGDTSLSFQKQQSFQRQELELVEQQQKIAQDSQEEDEEDNLMGINLDEDEIEGDEQEDNDKPISAEQLEENTKKRYLTMVIRILRFLQLLCEGHYSDLQNNLREQINAQGIKIARSFDFVAYTSQMFAIYVKSYVNCYSTNLGNQIIETLIELIQGPCRDSQRTLVDTKTIDCCRDLLNQGMGSNANNLEQKGFGGKRIEKLNNMKMNSVKLLLSILEGPVDPQISARISQSLGDFGVVIRRMEDVYYQFLEEELNLPKEAPEYKVKKALKKDSFDSCILEGFDIFSLIMQLVEVNPEDEEKLRQFERKQFYQFYHKNSGNIEVNTEFDILRIYFPLQPKCCFLTEKTKMNFTLRVERESGQHKLQGLCAWIPTFIEEMEHLEVMSHQVFQITPSRLNLMKDISTFLALAIGGIIISTYKYDYTELESGFKEYSAITGETPNMLIFILGCIQMVTSFMLVVGFMVNSASLIVKAGWRDRVTKNEIEMSVEKRELQKMREKSFKELDVNKLEISVLRTILQIEGPYSPVFINQNGQRNLGGPSMLFEYYWISLTFLISNGTFLFNVMYFVFSVQGLIQSPVFYSFHLLDVVNRFSALQNVIKAVTLNLEQILMTSMLGAIIIYNYAIFAFLFLADNYFDSTIEKGQINKAGDSVCMSLLHCYFSTLNYGLRLGGGIGEFVTTTQDPSNTPNLIIWFVFGLTFFLIITTIILNVVFGIIIDSFAQLRETSSNTEQDIKNYCFMCNLDRYTLDRDTEEGFDDHIERDHFLWNYVYFIIHLKQKDPSDYNGTESSIAQMLKAEEIEWFPSHKSIRMNQTLALRKKGGIQVEEQGEMEQLQNEFEKLGEALTKFEGMKD